MACKCNEVTTVLKCTNCGKVQTIGHAKSENPLDEARKQGRQCRNCYSKEFIV